MTLHRETRPRIKNFPLLHNSAWPGLVGKGDKPGQEPSISFERMLDLTAAAEVNGIKFDGVDIFAFFPHLDPIAPEDEIKRIADLVSSRNLRIGSIVAPVWPGTVGDSAMGDEVARAKFLMAVRGACRIAKLLNKHGVREYGVIRVDSAEHGVTKWRENPKANTARIVETFKLAAEIAREEGEHLAAEGEICWAGMHSWKDMLDVLEGVDMPGVFGFQADLAHTYLYALGYNAPEHALVKPGYTPEEFWPAYRKMVSKLRDWTLDFHVAQNDGTVFGAGDHEKTGKHCQVDDPDGKLDIVRASELWLEGAPGRRIRHITWDGCMFPNKVIEDPETANKILAMMLKVRDLAGWNE